MSETTTIEDTNQTIQDPGLDLTGQSYIEVPNQIGESVTLPNSPQRRFNNSASTTFPIIPTTPTHHLNVFSKHIAEQMKGTNADSHSLVAEIEHSHREDGEGIHPPEYDFFGTSLQHRRQVTSSLTNSNKIPFDIPRNAYGLTTQENIDLIAKLRSILNNKYEGLDSSESVFVKALQEYELNSKLPESLLNLKEGEKAVLGCLRFEAAW